MKNEIEQIHSHFLTSRFAAAFHIFSLLIGVSLCAQAAPNVEMKATSSPPVIDGRLDDDAWQGAALIEGFFQREPVPGQEATEKTLVFITYDSDNIYFGFRCFESDPSGITAKEMARDANLGDDDRVQIILDTFLDGRNGYWFQIGPRGSIGDGLVSENGARFNKEWDGLWDGRARINGEGWDAEIIIPFKTLTFKPGQSRWGLKLIRYVKRKEEIMYWPEGNLDTFRFQISDSGTIDQLHDISQGVGLDVKPYGLIGMDTAHGTDREGTLDGGVDVFYQLTPGLKGAMTINTDFAETEVDSRRINLTRFPLLFPEKRDFFLDGSNYFSFGPSNSRLLPFFSRRLGLDERGNPMPIVWGAKLTGQQGDWNLGFMDIVDSRDGENRNFGVARVSRNLGAQSSAGLILTSGNALSDVQNSLVGGDIQLASSNFQGNKNIALYLFGVKSNTAGVTSGDTAMGFQFMYPNDFLDFSAGFQQIEENFLPGVGFVPRTDIRASNVGFHLGPRPNRFGIRQLGFGYEFEYLTDLENRLLSRENVFQPLSIRFNSGDTMGVSVRSRYEYLDQVFNIHPDYKIPQGAYEFHAYRAAFQSAQRRNLWFTTSYGWGGFYNGRRSSTEAALGYKVAVPLYLGVEADRSHVFLPEGDFQANISRLTANILFSPNITLYNFVQYDNFSENLGWQSRFYWILKPGNEIIVVWNSRWNDPFDSSYLAATSTRIKINYNYRF